MAINYNTHIKLDPITPKTPKPTHIYKPDPLIYDKNEEAIITEAIKIGYLVYPSKEILWKLFQSQPNYDEFKDYLNKKHLLDQHHNINSRSKTYTSSDYEDLIDLNAIKHLNLSQLHVLEIGDVCFCERLQVLNLSNNYITRMDSLIQCTSLIRLDLHNNQINAVPDMKFWGRLKNLKVLYLHNNPIGKLDNLRRMAASQTLEILTLYDTPLSLKKNYRHHVVNIIFTLKALDDYIISDEEIIEDAKFNNNFSAKSNNLHVNVYIPPSKTNDFYDEIRLTNELLKRINTIISHFSPVHIIQKNIRAFLDRKYFQDVKDSNIWAAIKIQKWWRKIKKLEYKAPKLTQRRPIATNLQKHNISLNTKTLTDNQTSSFISQSQDEFMPGKKRIINNTPLSKNNLVIDLDKLQNRSSSMLEILNKEAQDMVDSTLNIYQNNQDRSRSEFDLYQSQVNQQLGQSTKYSKTSESSRKKKLRKIDMDKFFELGQLLNKLTTDFHGHMTNNGIDQFINHEVEKAEKEKNLKDPNVIPELDEDDNTEKSYRLPLLSNKSELQYQNKYIFDLINEKKFYRHVIQELELEAHKKMYEMRENVEIVNKKPIKTNDQRFFQKIYGTMTLGCLRAVDKAYIDRASAERKQAQIQAIQRYKENKEFTHQQVNYYREERLREVQKLRERDRLHLTVAKRRLELERIQSREHVQEMKAKLRDINLDRRKDILIAVDFNKQHLSVSKALQKHEYNLKRESLLKKNMVSVESLRESNMEQQEIVKKYLQQRNLLRVSQSVTDREQIDSQILKDANDRLLSAKKRVSRLKASKNALSKFYALHNGTKASDRTISSFAIPFIQSVAKTPHTGNKLRVTVLDTNVLAQPDTTIEQTPSKNQTPLSVHSYKIGSTLANAND